MKILLVIVVVGLVIALTVRQNRSRSDSVRTKESNAAPSQPSKPRVVVQTAQKRTGVFNAEDRRHLERPRVVEGAAWITDGDTIKIKNTQIRLYGIDAPELDHPYGKKAKWALHQLCKGQTVRAEITDEDDYGRTVAHCFLPDGRDLSAEMVKLGMAIDWPKFSGGKYKGLEVPGVRKRLFLADARQKGRMHVWERYQARRRDSEE